LYWFYREKAIVQVQIILGLIPVIVVFLLVKKFRLQHYPLPSFQKFRELAFPMLKLGLSTMVSGLVLLIALWLVRILVQRQFGNAGVGQFQAGWGVTTIYLQMIFQAMSRDYYPRLSGLSGNHASMVKLVNEQLHLALLLGTPLLLLAISAAPIIIQALYSDGFDSAVIQLQWLALGTVFKLVSWPLGFVLLALRKSGIYLLTETIAAVGLFAFSYFFMGYFGLNGIGLAYSINYVVYSLLVLVLSMNLIDFKFDSFTKLLLGLSVALSLFVFYSFTYTDQLVLKVLSCLASILMTTYYLIQLNKRTGLINYLCNRILKKGI
jgi:PST family polysaccharide transporter